MPNQSPKEYRNIAHYPDTWAIKHGLREGKQIFVRIREGLVEAIGHTQYPIQIGVAIPLRNPTKDGLTTDVENRVLNEIEQSLQNALTENDEAVFALAITHNGMREFVFYASAKDSKYFEQKVRSIKGGSYELQFMMQDDPEWAVFKQFVG